MYSANTSSVALPKTVENVLLRTVYNWMALGLFISAITAYVTTQSEWMLNIIFGNSYMFYILIFAELGLVIAISGAINKLSASTASGLFLLYSFLNGLTLSAILLVYTASSVFQVFLITALMFGAMSAYGYFTKSDLSSWGRYLFMGLIGIIIASVVNIFLANSTMDWLISFVGVIIFTGLTAYDTQKIKRMGEELIGADGERIGKVAILGALALYLDFINLFLMLLRFFGQRRD